MKNDVLVLVFGDERVGYAFIAGIAFVFMIVVIEHLVDGAFYFIKFLWNKKKQDQ